MTPQQIDYVLALAEEGSFSKAAKRLYVTQPSLSQFIRNFEEQLGVRLFDRSASPIRLTREGECCVAAAKRMQAIRRDMDNELSDLIALRRGTLVIGTTAFRAAYLLPQSIAAFRSCYGGVQINIVEAEMNELERGIQDGSIDLAMGYAQPDPQLFYSEFLTQERLYLAVAPENPLCEQLAASAVTAEELRAGILPDAAIALRSVAGEQLVLSREEERLGKRVRTLCESAGVPTELAIQVRHMETAFSFILQGIGVGFVPDSMVRYGNYARHPRYYLLPEADAIGDLRLYAKRNRYLTRAAQEYIRILKELIGMGTWSVSGGGLPVR